MAPPSAAGRHAYKRVTKAAAGDVAGLADPVSATLADPLDAVRAAVSEGIAAYLATVTDPTTRYTAREYKSTLRFLKPAFALIAKLAPTITTALVDGSSTAADLATTHLDDQLEVIAPDSGHDAAVSPSVAKSLAKQFRTNSATSMAGLADDLRAMLAASVVAKESIEQLVSRLEGLDPGPVNEQLALSDWARSIAGHVTRIARGIHARATAWVDRVVTTETTDAYAQSFSDALDAATQTIPNLKRRWDARLDSKVCPTCAKLDGQVRAVDVMFDTDDAGTETLRRATVAQRASGKFDAPPAHPNCKCFLTVFRSGFDD